MANNNWYSKKGVMGEASFDCSVGEVIELCHSKEYAGVEADGYVRGFRMTNSNLGELRERPGSNKWNCVEYQHLKVGTQIIEFIEDMGNRRSTIEINGSMPIHDHSSIPQGGPAYATYYAEIEEDEEAEGT